MLIRFWVSTVPEFGFFPLPMALLCAFLVLRVSVPAISTRYPVLTQPCLFLQTALIAVLIQSAPLQDYFAMLFLSLGLIATRYLRPGRGGEGGEREASRAAARCQHEAPCVR
ncbi:MAG: hypothetical protein IMZ69_10470 [Spirochaetes bacterium]|nr:hypothetical protein [Spirochaetota bacterium]